MCMTFAKVMHVFFGGYFFLIQNSQVNQNSLSLGSAGITLLAMTGMVKTVAQHLK